MKTKKRLIFTVLSAFILFAFVAVFNARAIYDNGEGLAVGIKVDVSKDGTNFYNYYSAENPGIQTLTVSPGDTLTFRGTVWNAGEFDTFLSLIGDITKSQYFESFDAFEGGNDDIDGSGGYYVLNDSSIVDDAIVMNIGIESHLDTTKNEADPEIGQITATLKSDIPDQTLIEGTFLLMGATRYVTFNPFPVAHAQEALDYSYVRILVNNPSIPATTPTIAPTVTTLPQTGPDYYYLKNFIISGVIFVFALILWIGLGKINKKEEV